MLNTFHEILLPHAGPSPWLTSAYVTWEVNLHPISPDLCLMTRALSRSNTHDVHLKLWVRCCNLKSTIISACNSSPSLSTSASYHQLCNMTIDISQEAATPSAIPVTKQPADVADDSSSTTSFASLKDRIKSHYDICSNYYLSLW